MRRARKGARQESYSKHVALDVVKRHKSKFNLENSNEFDDRDEDMYNKGNQTGGNQSDAESLLRLAEGRAKPEAHGVYQISTSS